MKNGIVKIGLFGGSFDPIHYGHLQIAEWTKNKLALDKIIFIPAAIPPHKLRSVIASAEHRFNMTQLAIQDHPDFKISDVEINRKGISYTIDTIYYFREKHHLQKNEIFLLIGGDSLIDLPTWRFPDRIVENCTVVVYQRHGADLDVIPEKYVKKVRILETPLIDISSTSIREKIAAGTSISTQTSPSVAQYIEKHNLYRTS